ncbi:MAG: S41 family peptidase [Rhodospirillales bacterium]|jgi:carboxyl-terminal processing protease|nr:S41 family peptidase [Rhodospirillales bacterium]MDP6644868.1 S41 family peptidase [Rhodospirillales bacterium]MDP6840442.1 S41 family peptidase [Rhodospirillales bacterium]
MTLIKRQNKYVKKYVTAKAYSPVLTVTAILVMLTGVLTGCGDASMARVFGGFDLRSSHSVEANAGYEQFKARFAEVTLADGSRGQQLKHFADAFERVRDDYVHPTDEAKMIETAVAALDKIKEERKTVTPAVAAEAALDAIMATLDPHSSYLNPAEFKESQVVTSGQFGGLGIEINMEDGLIRVIAPIADTPAERAGLKSGDLITHVDGDPIKGMSLMQAVRRLRGAPNSKVRLGIRRAKKNDFDVVVTRAIIRVQPVKWATEGDIGVIRVTHFISSSEGALESAMDQVRGKLGPRLKGLVLDLRNNPGGLLNQSVAVADAFLHRGTVVSVRDRDGNGRGFDAARGDIAAGLPMVVLINRGSASASEIVAGALQDHKRAVLMGGQSFGKGSVQTISPLEWDGALRLTTALYYLPSGRTIQGHGVIPDIVVNGKAVSNARRESDLPNAFTGAEKLLGRAAKAPQLAETNCPAAGTDGKDKLLGCAVMLLHAGSQKNFFALIGVRKSL